MATMYTRKRGPRHSRRCRCSGKHDDHSKRQDRDLTADHSGIRGARQHRLYRHVRGLQRARCLRLPSSPGQPLEDPRGQAQSNQRDQDLLELGKTPYA